MKKKVQIEEVPGKFQELLATVLKGYDVIIMDKGRAVAKFVRIESGKDEKKEDKWTTDDFNIQLPE
jgi:antitoxin (DNA-binding transcriptional repressor) of toxin-antitoxin stability system